MKRLTRSDAFVPSGGLDQVTPPLMLRDGASIDMLNFECDVSEGYSRIGGYDRWNGSHTLSSLSIQIGTISLLSGTTMISGDQLVGAQSGAIMTYQQVVNNPFDTGVNASGISTGHQAVYVSDVRGEFLAGEDLTVVGSTGSFYRVIQPPTFGNWGSAKEHAVAMAEYRDACRLAWRKPGDKPTFDETGTAIGPVLGVAHYRGETLVFRESASDNSKTVLLQPATELDSWIHRYGQWRGSFPLAIDPAGARFSFIEHNFGGGTETKSLYGVSGTGQAFSYDGTNWAFIPTQSPSDKPTHIVAHVNRLILAIGTNLLISAADDISRFDVVNGAAAIATGDTIVGLHSMKGSDSSDVLLVVTESRLLLLYGTGNDSYTLRPLQNETGAADWSLQSLSQPVFMTDFGVSTLAATEAYGGFNSSSVSEQMKPWLVERQRTVVASVIVRKKNQYRLFFDDGHALYITMDGKKVKGMAPIYLGKKVTCTWSGIDDTGAELVLFGATDGGVYKLDEGSSFDGDAMLYYVRMAFNHSKRPRTRKRYRRLVVEIDRKGFAEFDVGHDLDYANVRQDVTPAHDIETSVYGAGGLYDESIWDEAYFDDGYQVPIVVSMTGSGNNVSVRIRGNANYVDPFRLTGVIIDYDERRDSR